MATPKPHPEYVETLKRYIEELERQGASVGPRTSLWRFKSSRPSAIPTLKLAETIRAVIQTQMPDVRIPPPIVAIRNSDQFRWVTLGEWLMENDPEMFERIAARIEEIKTGREAEQALGVGGTTQNL